MSRSSASSPLEPSRARYDALTRQAAVFASEAYQDPVPGTAKCGVFLSDPCTDAQCTLTFSDDDPDTPAIESRTATVAFRGSSSRADWIGNTCFALSSLPSPHRSDVKAHGGFLRQYVSLHSHILKELEKRAEVRHVVLTGHSLGGALAVIAAAMLPPPYTCDIVTFGAPRPGNRQLRDAAFHKARSLVRVVHDRDIVPSMPLGVMGFRHACDAWLALDEDGFVERKDREMSLWSELWMRACGMVFRDLGIGDHSMRNYLSGCGDDGDDGDACGGANS